MDSPDKDFTALVQELTWLEQANVFFSVPIDLDMTMLCNYPDAYDVADEELAAPDDSTVRAVLGKNGVLLPSLLEYRENFDAYQRRFKLGSKPSSHLDAMSQLDDKQLIEDMPPRLQRLIDRVADLLMGIPE